MRPDFIGGLDLGQTTDFSALAVLERAWEPGRAGRKDAQSAYSVRHLERFPLGTPYTAVCTRVADLFAAPPLAGSRLAVDQTGVGRPVVDVLRAGGSGGPLRAVLTAVTITAGSKAHKDEAGDWMVPKKELVSTLQVLLQARRLKVSAALPEATTLVKELKGFQVKITAAANETFGAAGWREGSHDDLVLAVAIAAWEGERCRPIRFL